MGGACWIENRRTTGVGAASIVIVGAEANADADVEESDAENALLAVAAAVDGAELGGMLFISCLHDTHWEIWGDLPTRALVVARRAM